MVQMRLEVCGSQPDEAEPASRPRLRMIKAFLEKHLASMQVSNDLFQALVFVLERFHLRNLRTRKTSKRLAPEITTLIRNPSFATRTYSLQTIVQININLAQLLHIFSSK